MTVSRFDQKLEVHKTTMHFQKQVTCTLRVLHFHAVIVDKRDNVTADLVTKLF